jgi:putative membrane protein
MYKRRRFLGTYLGVAAAAALLPGITSRLDDGAPWGVVLAGAVFVIVNQLIYTYPHAIRSAPPLALLILAVIGVAQDTLLWLLVSWIGAQLDYGLHVDGFLTALLGGLVVRAIVLVLISFGPQPEPETAS